MASKRRIKRPTTRPTTARTRPARVTAPDVAPEFAQKPTPLAATVTALAALDRQKLAYVEVSPCCYRVAGCATFTAIGIHGPWSFGDGCHGYGVASLVDAFAGRRAFDKAFQAEKVA